MPLPKLIDPEFGNRGTTMEKTQLWLTIAVVTGLSLAIAPPSFADTRPVRPSQADTMGNRPKERVSSSQRQTNTVSLERSALGSPHDLRITVPADINGQIEIDGTIVKTFGAGVTTLDLTSYLSLGTTAIGIRGTYWPASASVTIELQGPNVQIQQQTSGSGQLDYRLNLIVE